MNIEEFNKIYKENEDLLITVKALFLNRNIEGENQVVYVEMSLLSGNISLLDIISQDINNGKSIVYAVPVAILSDEKSADFRKELIEHDYVDMIMLIPQNWIKDAHTNIALLFLNRKNRQRGIVKFIDITYDSGSDFFPGKCCTANLIFYDSFPGYNNLLGDFEDEDGDFLQNYFDEFIYVAGHYLIMLADYSLHPCEYIHRLPSYKGYKLYELWDFEDNDITNAKGLIIHTSNLKDSSTHYKIDLSLIEASEEYGKFNSLNGRYVLIAKQGKLRPTLIDTEGMTMYVPSNEIEALRENDDFYLDYFISELRKQYVTQQLDKWRKNIVSYLRIFRPFDTDKKTSLELQKDIFVRSKFSDVCEYCKHPDLIDLLAELSNEKIKTDSDIPHKVRNVMENYVISLLLDNDIKPLQIKNGEKKELEKSKWKTNIRGYSYAIEELKAPKHVQRSFHTISDLAPEGAHDTEDTHIQKLIREGTAPYLTTTLVYDLINVVVWCKKFENKRI